MIRSRLVVMGMMLFVFISSIGQNLERLPYNSPDLLVDLGVGLWAWPIPLDYNEDGLIDLIVICTDTPYKGTYYFENSGETDPITNSPVFEPAIRVGEAVDNVSVSYPKTLPLVTSPGKVYPEFTQSIFNNPIDIGAPDIKKLYYPDINTRAYQWQYVDFNSDGVMDLLVGIGVWGPRDFKRREFYGWDDAYDEKGNWINGPIHGYLYLIENTGTNEDPEYREPQKITDFDGRVIDVFGRPSPNFVDFNGDGRPDLICGEFKDGFTFYENIGSKANPIFARGRPLTYNDEIIRMDLCMITPVAYDFNGDGWPDLIVGDEDGRVALIEHSGEIKDGLPLFLPPKYFKQRAKDIKFGALATPFGFDWNGDGLDDILVGNTAGQIGFIENLGGDPVEWAAPRLLESDGEIIRIMAGSNGSIQGPAEEKWGYTTLSVTDWNHNGLPDILINSIWGKILWYENIGTRTEPKLGVPKEIEVEWTGKAPKPKWNWWNPEKKELVTQWRTTPIGVDWNGDGFTDLIVLDHEGYLSLFQREKVDDSYILLPGERIFYSAETKEPLRLNDKEAGGSGRRKIAIVDLDGDGRLDILINSTNANFYKNVETIDGITYFQDMGSVDERKLAGHTSSPTTIRLTREGSDYILIGAEDGYLYIKKNPYSDE